jgi:hypothetical protein
MRPDLPIIFTQSFTTPISDWENVIGEAVRRIDRVLAV